MSSALEVCSQSQSHAEKNLHDESNPANVMDGFQFFLPPLPWNAESMYIQRSPKRVLNFVTLKRYVHHTRTFYDGIMLASN